MVYPTPPKPRGEGEAWKAAAESGPKRVTRPAASDTDTDAAGEEALARELQLAFAPIHKRAFGTAVGVAFALLVAAVTLVHLLLDPESTEMLGLLGQYFYGYSVSPAGILVGAFWGFVSGFVAGWFAAFCRNLAIAVPVFITRTRAELAETREFLDHI